MAQAFCKIAPGLQEADILVYGLRLAQLMASGKPEEDPDMAHRLCSRMCVQRTGALK